MIERKRTAVLLAAGSGLRIGGDIRKQYIEVGGEPLFVHAVRALMTHPGVTDGVLVVPAGDEDHCRAILAERDLHRKICAIVPGGAERYHSVANALAAIDWPCEQVFIHDCARPLIDPETIDRLCDALEADAACVAGMPAKDTVKISDAAGLVEQTPDRQRVWIVQTPQAFAFPMIREAYVKLLDGEADLLARGIRITDDAMVVEHMTDHPVRMVEASYRNIKVTTPEDLVIAEALMSGGRKSPRRPEALQPSGVFRRFAEIAAIPRPSYHEEAISDYLVRFAKERGLEHYRDSAHNVTIIKEATPGYEAAEPVILQGHMDMVCEQETDCGKDMHTEGLDLFVEGDWIGARGTTLGGDDGIALACALAILEDEAVKHPRLEAVFTTAEEVGMEGAQALDVSVLRGRRLINIDSENEREIVAGCAGGCRICITLPVAREEALEIKEGEELVRITAKGFRGGHSGTEIDKGRANAIHVLAHTIHVLRQRLGTSAVRLLSLDGGGKDNAIPREAEAILLTDDAPALTDALSEIEEQVRAQYEGPDPEIRLILEGIDEKDMRRAEMRPSCADEEHPAGKSEPGRVPALEDVATSTLFAMIDELPDGVQAMHTGSSEYVETSLNLGVCRMEADQAVLTLLLRSTRTDSLSALTDQVCAIAQAHGAQTSRDSEYPAWEYRENAPFREKMVRIYEEVFKRKPDVKVIHAGLECGILTDKMPGLEAVSIGPDIPDIHTPKERMSISSVGRVYEYLLRVLADQR